MATLGRRSWPALREFQRRMTVQRMREQRTPPLRVSCSLCLTVVVSPNWTREQIELAAIPSSTAVPSPRSGTALVSPSMSFPFATDVNSAIAKRSRGTAAIYWVPREADHRQTVSIEAFRSAVPQPGSGTAYTAYSDRRQFGPHGG